MTYSYRIGAVKKAPFFVLLLTLFSCASVDDRRELANAIAASGQLTRSEPVAGAFRLRQYVRITSPQEANIYIEGDGLAWLSRAEISPNPTPTDPIALRLAAKDDAASVIYLARPCQYVADEKCSADYWTHKRYAPEVIDAYMRVLDGFEFKKIHLIGYSGGGGIAAILAAKRGDVASLRTVAGNVDINAFSALHHVSAMEGSLNPADYAKTLRAIPQIHFIGQDDKVVTEELFRHYITQTGATCTQLRTIAKTNHENGWEAQWPALLTQTPTCDR
jgi:hypothetical protein